MSFSGGRCFHSRFLLFYSLILFSSFLPAEEKCIVLGTQKKPENVDYRFLDLVYSEIFDRLGWKLVIENYPPSRSSVLSDTGVTDGELSRIYKYGESHGNLCRVEEPHWHTGFIAITNSPALELDGWKSLKGTFWKVDYMRGVYGCELNLPRVVSEENLSSLDYGRQGFDRLIYGRSDVFIIAEIGGMNRLRSTPYADAPLRVAGLMECFTSHMYLNKERYESLAESISPILKNMRRNGVLADYTERVGLIRYLVP